MLRHAQKVKLRLHMSLYIPKQEREPFRKAQAKEESPQVMMTMTYNAHGEM